MLEARLFSPIYHLFALPYALVGITAYAVLHR